jgi:hypothetical protein
VNGPFTSYPALSANMVNFAHFDLCFYGMIHERVAVKRVTLAADPGCRTSVGCVLQKEF